MFTARKKIAKEKGAEPDVFEESVAQVGSRAVCTQRVVQNMLQLLLVWQPPV